jgi:hypothetical protein
MSSSEWMVLIWGLAVGFCILRVFGPKVLLVVLVTPVALGTAVLGFVMARMISRQ